MGFLALNWDPETERFLLSLCKTSTHKGAQILWSFYWLFLSRSGLLGQTVRMFSELQTFKKNTRKKTKAEFLNLFMKKKSLKTFWKTQLFLQCINLPVKTNDFGGITKETVEFTEKL